MNRQQVQSSNIHSIGYDSDENILEIQFHGGGIYQYSDVPENVYSSLMNAPSKGKYFASNIRGRYLTNKVG